MRAARRVSHATMTMGQAVARMNASGGSELRRDDGQSISQVAQEVRLAAESMNDAGDLVLLEGPPGVIAAAERLMAAGAVLSVESLSPGMPPGRSREEERQTFALAFQAFSTATKEFISAAQKHLNGHAQPHT
ncbi:hypothetical protein ACWCXX_37615 [Streptomyces sp. NPDC001732]